MTSFTDRHPMTYAIVRNHPEAEGLHPTIADLRRRRIAAGIPREHLARVTGCALGSMCKWERGERYPHPHMLAKWSDALESVEKELRGC